MNAQAHTCTHDNPPYTRMYKHTHIYMTTLHITRRPTERFSSKYYSIDCMHNLTNISNTICKHLGQSLPLSTVIQYVSSQYLRLSGEHIYFSLHTPSPIAKVLKHPFSNFIDTAYMESKEDSVMTNTWSVVNLWVVHVRVRVFT